MDILRFILFFFLFACSNSDNISINTNENLNNDSFKLISKENFDKQRIKSIQENNDTYDISFGSSSGMCIQDCITTNIVTSEGIINIIQSNDSIRFQKKNNIINNDMYNYDSIISLFNFDEFLSMEQINTDGDITDKGVYWIKISNSSESRKIYYDLGKEPIELKGLINYLNSII